MNFFCSKVRLKSICQIIFIHERRSLSYFLLLCFKRLEGFIFNKKFLALSKELGGLRDKNVFQYKDQGKNLWMFFS